MLKLYHFSVTFKGRSMTYHGDFTARIEPDQPHAIEELSIIAEGVLKHKMKEWHVSHTDIIDFTLYIHDKNGREIVLAKNEKASD